MIKLILGAIGWQGIALAAAGIVLAFYGTYEVGHWRGDTAGRAAERAAALQHSIDLIRDRSDTNEKINDLDDADLCRALGGRWLLPDNVCQ